MNNSKTCIPSKKTKHHNHVGYGQNDTEASGKVTVGSFFANLNKNAKFTLADLSVTGYPEKSCSGQFVLQKLDASGASTSANSFYWFDDANHAAGWYDRKGQKPADTTFEFNQGQGFWTQGYGNKLVSAGEVTKDTILCPTEASGKVSIVNATPILRKLYELYVTGYPEKSCSGQFVMQKLDASGASTAANSYYWFDDANHVAGWYDRKGQKPAENIDVPSGTGFWVQGYGNTLVLPKTDIE